MARTRSPHLGVQLGDIRAKYKRIEAKQKRGARTFHEMELDGTVRRFPQTASLSRR